MKLTRIATEDLVAFMAPYDMDDLPDGAWFHLLEEAAEKYIKETGIKGWDENSLAHYYLNNKPRDSA
jgi:hypothetical protein